jgi:hypothetical protein
MLWSDIGKKEEEFEPRPRAVVMDIFDHFQKKRIYITQKSIVSLRLDDVTVETPRKVGLITQMVQGKKAFTTRVAATPKIVLSQGSLLIGKRVRVDVEGETRDQARAEAAGAMGILTKALVDEARVRGLMA